MVRTGHFITQLLSKDVMSYLYHCTQIQEDLVQVVQIVNASDLDWKLIAQKLSTDGIGVISEKIF